MASVPLVNLSVRAVLRPGSLQTELAPIEPGQVLNRNWTMLLCVPLVVWGFIGNSMVCVAIYTDKRLHNVTNYFLFSLAVADLLVCSFVMPLSIWLEVNNNVWFGSFGLCVIYSYMDVFLCSGSIVHMSVISLDRYLGISNPFKTRNKSRTVVIIKIITVWVITVIISSPLAALALYKRDNIMRGQRCQIFNRYFMVYGSILAFLIPFIIMIITYLRTTKLLRHQSELLSEKSAGGGAEPITLRRTITSTTQRRSIRQGSRRPSTATDGNRLAPDRPDISPNVGESGRRSSAGTERGARYSVGDQSVTSLMDESKGIKRFKERTCHFLTAIAKKASRNVTMSQQQQELANERKATRVLGVVFGCFFICWTPFFVMNFTSAFCGDYCSENMPPILPNVVLWLGYISSTINPVIYTIFNKKFRQTFSSILRCRCISSRHSLQMAAISNWRATAVPSTVSNGSAASSIRCHKRPHNDFSRTNATMLPSSDVILVSSGEGTPIIRSPTRDLSTSDVTYRRRLSEPTKGRAARSPETPSTRPTTLPLSNEEPTADQSKAQTTISSPIHSSLCSDDAPHLPSDGSDCERLLRDDSQSPVLRAPSAGQRRKVTYPSGTAGHIVLLPKSRSMPLRKRSRQRTYTGDLIIDNLASLGPLLQSCEETVV